MPPPIPPAKSGYKSELADCGLWWLAEPGLDLRLLAPLLCFLARRLGSMVAGRQALCREAPWDWVFAALRMPPAILFTSTAPGVCDAATRATG